VQISKLVKSIWKVLPLLVVIVIVVSSILMVRNLHRTPLSAGVKATAELSMQEIKSPTAEPDLPQLSIMPEEMDTCVSEIYLTWPPKCMAANGKVIQVPGSPNIFVIPPVK
jgi:hypothetical protein